MTKLFSRTLRETPGKTESKGHEYLLRAGYIRQSAAGIYTALPLAFRSLRKIEQIIRDEMNAIGGLEMLMPVVNPAEIWKETGRWFTIDAELSRFKDRNDRDMVLAMTHEEAVTDIMRDEIQTYRQLPCMVYHIQTKWRDDPRPRAGLIRVREFTMKDSYSFDRDYAGLEKQYDAHYHAYFRIFKRCGLPVIAVASDTGMMGGKVSHEYMYLNPIGEDTLILCSDCDYSANRQVAEVHKQLYPEDLAALDEVETPNCATIEELANFLNIPTRKTAKAVMVMGRFVDEKNEEETREKLILAIIRGDMEIEEAKLQKASGALSLRPAHEEEIRACGLVPGYASPVGIRACMIIVDDSAAGSNNLVGGANRAGYHLLNTNFGRDYSGTIADIASARDGMACPKCGKKLEAKRGVEVGNIFQLGTRYSESMGCTFQDENGRAQPVVMGSYGIGVGRLLACLAEEYNDDKGLKLPASVAPFHVHIVNLLKTSEEAEKIYADLIESGLEVILDDRKETAGVKFNDADLLGMPLRITLGNKALKDGEVEFSRRGNGDNYRVPLAEVLTAAREAVFG
ncbi:proline--tRNA ligase [Marispirochaeta aestuarii]|uniref:proline--tRNA ligase n=1 Tax=Marispirochaeta aestuarii TaxID=1963862 RepID=UPI002ABDDB71|nr:proline--tRNA ligase [Marispirochaeta aestuarii]